MKTTVRTKPATTAPMESSALTLRLCSVNSVMTTRRQQRQEQDQPG